MISKKLLSLFLILFSTSLFAQDAATSFKLYGFIRNDFYYNSRLNKEALDGIFNLYPEPVVLENGKDKNDIPNSEMISIGTRLGVDFSGNNLLGAKSTAKIECDFGGFGTNYYVIRLRHAYFKLNWTKTELLMGQFWHPLFGSIMPTNPSFNAGTPFQPFNRSPQLRVKQDLSKTLSFSAAAIYQMQFLSQGPLNPSSSASYSKNSQLPEIFVGFENKTAHWTTGVGASINRIKPTNTTNLVSAKSIVYAQYVRNKLQIKAKTFYGENSSDLTMLGGYAASNFASDSTTVTDYTNFNYLTSWFNIVYGKKWQVGLLLGLSKNTGTNDPLAINKKSNLEYYGFGTYPATQTLLDRLYRIAPHVSYNLSNLKFGLEYDITSADYGTLKTDGKVINPVKATNNRFVASVVYLF